MRRHAFFGVALTLLTLAPASLAQRDPRRAEWRRLLTQANDEQTHGNHARALELFERASQIEMTPALRLSIAREHEALSHLPDGEAHRREAHAMALQCVQDAESSPALPDRERVQRACEAVAYRTRPIAGDGGTDVPPPPVDAAVDAPPADAPPHAPPVEDGGVAREFPDAPPPPPPPPGLGAGPWILTGSGVAVAALSGLFFALQAQATQDRHAQCDHANGIDICNSTRQRDYAAEANDRELRYRALGVVSLSVGLSAVVGGVLWYALAPRGHTAPQRASLRWSVSPVAGGALAGFEGVW